MPDSVKPHRLTLRTYQVGFGDCFLLTYHYENLEDRHVLIDFGSTAAPETALKRKNFKMSRYMMEVAESIREQCQGKLHVVVASHRHRDHISGFATRASGDGPGDVIRSLNPDLVIQPWTEDPDAAPDAAGPSVATASSGALGIASKAYIGALQEMHGVSTSVLEEVRRAYPEIARGGNAKATEGRAISYTLANRLSFLGECNLANKSAVENLRTLGRDTIYVSYGHENERSTQLLEEILPGVGVRFLGPPTIEQDESIAKQRSSDQDEFWHLQARACRSAVRPRRGLFSNALSLDPEDVPRSNRWLTDRMRRLRGQQLLEIVRILDRALNNTSVILLFEVGGEKLLFPGDAQIESWNHVLKGPDGERNRELLKEVTVYKVGHHGSLNATPKTLWNGFARRSKDDKDPSRLKTLVSTRRGRHGSSQRATEIPRKTLMEALQEESEMLSTELHLRTKADLFSALELDL